MSSNSVCLFFLWKVPYKFYLFHVSCSMADILMTTRLSISSLFFVTWQRLLLLLLQVRGEKNCPVDVVDAWAALRHLNLLYLFFSFEIKEKLWLSGLHMDTDLYYFLLARAAGCGRVSLALTCQEFSQILCRRRAWRRRRRKRKQEKGNIWGHLLAPTHQPVYLRCRAFSIFWTGSTAISIGPTLRRNSLVVGGSLTFIRAQLTPPPQRLSTPPCPPYRPLCRSWAPFQLMEADCGQISLGASQLWQQPIAAKQHKRLISSCDPTLCSPATSRRKASHSASQPERSASAVGQRCSQTQLAGNYDVAELEIGAKTESGF